MDDACLCDCIEWDVYVKLMSFVSFIRVQKLPSHQGCSEKYLHCQSYNLQNATTQQNQQLSQAYFLADFPATAANIISEKLSFSKNFEFLALSFQCLLEFSLRFWKSG